MTDIPHEHDAERGYIAGYDNAPLPKDASAAYQAGYAQGMADREADRLEMAAIRRENRENNA